VCGGETTDKRIRKDKRILRMKTQKERKDFLTTDYTDKKG
jgi:hypothetical protein